MLLQHAHTIDLGSGTTYKRGKYSVSVRNDGSILVRSGDWLTKYSAAMYGNFWTIDVFCRKDKSGNYIPITHAGRIFAGETLYHMPTVKNDCNGTGNCDENRFATAVGNAPPVSEIAKTKLAVDQFKASHPEWSEIGELAGTAGHAATDVVEGLEWFSVVSDTAAAAVFPIGLIIFCLHATFDIIDAYNAARHAIAVRAAAYGATAWAFDDPVPPPPQWLGPTITPQAIQRALQANPPQYGRTVQGAVLDDQYAAAQRQKSWIEGRDKAMKELDEMVEQQKVRKAACQVVFQAIGSNDPKTLALQIMTEKAKGLSDFWGHSASERSAFWTPAPKYPSS